MKKIILLLTLIPILSICCSEKSDKKPDSKSINNIHSENPAYQFQQPDQIWELPASLNEISGIALLNDSIMLCIQDEKGSLYYYNLLSNLVENKFKFSYDADYEDLTIAGKNVYILRSNGWIYEIQDGTTGSKINIYKTGLSQKNDTEGLCFDPVANHLLISCKNTPGIKNASKNTKAVYAFDLATKKLSDKPVLVFTEKGITPSAIAIQPLTKNIYIISSPKKKILAFNSNGSILYYNDLNSSSFLQPEGLTFAPNGDIYISNEGRGGRANILFFRNKNSEKLK